MSDVSNGPDWWQAGDGKWYPPDQQPRAQSPLSPPLPPPTPAFSPRTRVSSRQPAVSFDRRRWTRPERITAIATLALLISLFLPWFTYNFGVGSVSVDGLWHGWMYLVFMLSLVILVYLVAKASYSVMPFTLPIAEAQFLLFATVANLVLTLLAFVLKPGGIGLSGIGWGFGAFIALIAAIVAAAPLGVPALRARRS